MTTTYTYRQLQSELKKFRDELGYTLEVKLNASAVDLALELDRITGLIEESEIIDNEDMCDETDDETETNEELELVEAVDYKGNEIVIHYQVDKGYTFEVNKGEIYQTPRSTLEETRVYARHYADKYIICDGSKEINYTYTPITKIGELTHRNQSIPIDK